MKLAIRWGGELPKRGRDLLNLISSNEPEHFIRYISGQLRSRNIVVLEVPHSLNGSNQCINKKISEFARDVLLNSCSSGITKIDITFNIAFDGAVDSGKYTIMKCRDGREILVVLKAGNRYVFAKGGKDIVEKILKETLEDIKMDIITSETSLKL
uniref:Uncharacterized protein n=1 Tax=Ignisphaera aggregans TaxID=334771 RepID=A0A7C2VH20_9CREN